MECVEDVRSAERPGRSSVVFMVVIAEDKRA